jgi:hypothetical protein
MSVMTAAGNVLALLGALVTGYGLLRIWRRTAPPGPVQTIAPIGIESGEAFGLPTVTSDNPNRSTAWVRKLGHKARRWVRFGRPIHHTGDASLDVTVTTTAGGEVTDGGTEGERLARLEQAIGDLREQQASSSAEAREHTADLIRQRLDDYRTTERANTRRQTLITATGLVMTVAGIVLRILAG